MFAGVAGKSTGLVNGKDFTGLIFAVGAEGVDDTTVVSEVGPLEFLLFITDPEDVEIDDVVTGACPPVFDVVPALTGVDVVAGVT